MTAEEQLEELRRVTTLLLRDLNNALNRIDHLESALLAAKSRVEESPFQPPCVE